MEIRWIYIRMKNANTNIHASTRIQTTANISKLQVSYNKEEF
jgi:hypothetical protein